MSDPEGKAEPPPAADPASDEQKFYEEIEAAKVRYINSKYTPEMLARDVADESGATREDEKLADLFDEHLAQYPPEEQERRVAAALAVPTRAEMEEAAHLWRKINRGGTFPIKELALVVRKLHAAEEARRLAEYDVRCYEQASRDDKQTVDLLEARASRADAEVERLQGELGRAVSDQTRAECQRCGKIGGTVVSFPSGVGMFSRWVCPHCMDATEDALRLAAQERDALFRLACGPESEITRLRAEVARVRKVVEDYLDVTKGTTRVALRAALAPQEGAEKK